MRSYWSFFNHREAGNPSNPESGSLTAKAGACSVFVMADSDPVIGLLGCHESPI